MPLMTHSCSTCVALAMVPHECLDLADRYVVRTIVASGRLLSS
jgi:hypothetical protein